VQPSTSAVATGSAQAGFSNKNFIPSMKVAIYLHYYRLIAAFLLYWINFFPPLAAKTQYEN
jgi:hypothetical protein